MKVVSYIKSILDEFINLKRHILILKLTLLFIVVFTRSDFYLHIPTKILATYMIFSDNLSAHKGLWGFLTFVHLLIIITQWQYIDNHKFLSVYWITTCFLSLFSKDILKTLQFNGRILIGLTFLFATFHKIAGGEYLNGKFFLFTFLTDSRFEWPVGLAAQLTMEKLPMNYHKLETLRSWPLDIKSITLFATPFIKSLAYFVSYWTIFIEGVIAIFFLTPTKYIISKYKDITLIIFILSTYLIVMVSGFYYLLFLLGFSQLDIKQSKSAYLYIFCLIVFEMRNIPFFEYLTYLGVIPSY